MTTITIGATAQIDLHSHAVTEGYLAFVKAHHAEMDEGFPIPQWNVESHLAFMDKAGIETSVLTMPAPQPWFGDGEATAAASPPVERRVRPVCPCGVSIFQSVNLLTIIDFLPFGTIKTPFLR